MLKNTLEIGNGPTCYGAALVGFIETKAGRPSAAESIRPTPSRFPTCEGEVQKVDKFLGGWKAVDVR